MVSQDVGVDGNKKIKGRKRRVMVNSLGLLLGVVVTAAKVGDSQGFQLLLEKINRTYAKGIKG
jgi:putative transposase